MVSEQALVDAHAHYAAAVAADADEDNDTALSEYYQAALADSTNEDLLLEVSRRFLEVRQPEKALALLTNATQNVNAPGSVFAVLGFIYSQLGQFDLAATADRTAIARTPRSLAGYQNLYLANIHNRQAAAAMQVLDDAAKVPDTDAEFLVGLSEMYSDALMQIPVEAKGARTRALAVLERARKQHPTDTLLRLRMADAFSAHGDDDTAAQLYLAVLADLDEPILRQGVRAKLADIYANRHDEKRAAEQLKEILREDPTNAKAYYRLGQMQLDANQYAPAAESLAKAIEMDPDYESA